MVNRFRCTNCNAELKCHFILPAIFLAGILVQVGVALFVRTEDIGSLGVIGLRSLSLALITLFMYPIHEERETSYLFVGGLRFILLSLAMLAIAWLVGFFFAYET